MKNIEIYIKRKRLKGSGVLYQGVGQLAKRWTSAGEMRGACLLLS